VSANGGGIKNAADLTINDCTISQNTAAAGGGIYAFAPGFFHTVTMISGSTISVNTATSQTSAAAGGGVYNLATLSLVNSSVTNNLAAGGSGMGAGGGIEDQGPMVIQSSHIDFNRAEGGASGVNGNGGGIDLRGDQAASGARVTILDSSISSNLAAGNGSRSFAGGGGLYEGGGAISPLGMPMTILGSTIANNLALGGDSSIVAGDAEGGGLDLQASPSVALANCTISGNSAMGGHTFGGGGGATAGGIDLNNGMIEDCTIAENAAIAGTGSTATAQAGGIDFGGGVDLTNSIIAANHAATDADIEGNFTTASFNLIGDGTGSNVVNGVSGNQVGTTASPIDPKLGPLANYGGPTQTQNLLPGSPAIDAGTDQDLQAMTDQRGYPRIYNGTVDQGAYESQPIHFLAVSADLGGGPEVKVYDETTGSLRLDFNAYEPTFTGGVRVAVADINGDGVPDIVTAPGGVKVTLVNVNGALVPSFDHSAGRAPEIKVFSGVDGSVLDDFLAYPSSFAAGVFVAVADVNNDGKPDIITGPEATGQPGHTNVRVFFNNHLINTGAALTPDLQFNAYAPGFGGGVRLAAADLNHDGFADIVTAPGIWSGPDVRIFDGQTLTKSGMAPLIGEFLAYDFRYFGGVFVSTGDVNDDGLPDIITGTNGNGGPEVKAFSGATVLSNPTPIIIDDFFAYNPAFNGGARVAVIDLNGQEDIVTGAGPGGGPHVRIFDGATGLPLTGPQDSFFAFDVLFSGGVFVGAGL
jgi:hypothetical protein